MPAPHAFAAVELVPEVHIFPPTLAKPVPVGAVTCAQFTFLRSLQSLYTNHDPWIPTVLLPGAM